MNINGLKCCVRNMKGNLGQRKAFLIIDKNGIDRKIGELIHVNKLN